MGTQKAALLMELQQRPLGSEKGEDFSVPMNYRIPPARVYVINHSRTRPWKRVIVPVSPRSGAEEALIYDKELAKIYNVDTLYAQIEKGKDMNRYKTEVHPVVFSFKVGSPTMGGKPVVYAIPPAKDGQSEPPRIEILEGAWDLYLGNYERMRGLVRDYRGNVVRENDATIMSDERSRLAVLWRARKNPVMSFTDDGETTDLRNPHGFLEFVRETQKQTVQPLDKEYLSALDILEV